MDVQFPERVALAATPTPLVFLERSSELLGVEVWVKRDDMTGIELSGNKVRKLEFLMADALAKGCDVVVTGGGEQSNHCRATALAATRLGLKSVLCLRTTDTRKPPQTRGNILMDRLAGSEIVWIDHEDWARQEEVYQEQATRLRKDGKTPYIIPEGGSNALGAWGYVVCAQELAGELAALAEQKPTTIVYACGSGGTGAGLQLGAALFGFAERNIEVAGVNVCDDADYFKTKIAKICDEVIASASLAVTIPKESISIVDGYVGKGYAQSSQEELECLRAMAEREAIFLDPVYSGKAWYGVVSELQKDPGCFGERIVFVLTGGLFGLFPQAHHFDALW